MKTSNKILLGLISFIGLSLLSVLIFAKSSLINVENSQVIGDGKIIKVNHNIGEIAFFRASHQYEIYLKKGEPALVIETDENIQAFLRPDFDQTVYTQKGGERVTKKRLRIGRANNYNLKPTDNIKIYISSPIMEKIEIGGSSKITFEDLFENETFEADIYDFAEVNANVNAKNLDLDISGSAQFNLKGSVGNTQINLADFANLTLDSLQAEGVRIISSGSSKCSISGQTKNLNINTNEFAKVNAINLNSENTIVEAKSSSEISISTSQSLDAKAIDFASIKYSGNPEITKNISSQAKLEAIQ